MPAAPRLELILLGVGAMRSPRYEPSGLLVRTHEGRPVRVAIDGGESSGVGSRLDAWLLTDERAELIAGIRRRARALGVEPRAARYTCGRLDIAPRRVRHTSHPTYAYEIAWRGRRVVWAPEFFRFPSWAAGADVLFADASGWDRPILFARGAGGHAAALDVAQRAGAARVRRLVFAHIGRPTIRATDAGARAPLGELGRDGARITIAPRYA